MNISLCLQRFYAAAQYQSFTEAAKQEGVTTPQITLNIDDLENEYNIQLFERGDGGNRKADTLTEHGHVLYYIIERHESAKEAEARKYLSDDDSG